MRVTGLVGEVGRSHLDTTALEDATALTLAAAAPHPVLDAVLEGVLEARGKVLVKLNVDTDRLDAVIAKLPAMRTPTVNELYNHGGYAVETVVAKSDINVLIPELKDAGATDIIELPLSKIVH